MRFYGGGYINTIKNVFPEIEFDESQFSLYALRKYYFLWIIITIFIILEEHWKDVKNRRRYFDSFANSHNFDPLLASNWYNLSIDKNDLKVRYSFFSFSLFILILLLFLLFHSLIINLFIIIIIFN